MNKFTYDSCIVLTNYLWDGITEHQHQTIHYIPHEIAFRKNIPVIFINPVPFKLLKKWPFLLRRYLPGIHKKSGSPLTIVNVWCQEWRSASKSGKKLPEKKIVARAMKAFSRTGKKHPLLLFSEPTNTNVIEKLKKSCRTQAVWLCTDDFASDDELHKEVIHSHIEKLGLIADAVCTVSETLKVKYEKMLPTIQISNAADRYYFQKILSSTTSMHDILGNQDISHPRIVYVGMINHRINRKILLKAIRDLPECSFIFIGKEASEKSDTRYAQIYEAKNTFFLGEKNRYEIAQLFSVCDIGIIPYTDSEFNRGSCPLKLYEYAAANLPVVSTSLPALEHSRGAAMLVDGEEFTEAIATVLQNYDHYKERIIAFSKVNTWSQRIEKIFTFMERQLHTSIDE